MLHICAAKGYNDIIEKLLEAGFEVDPVDVDGWTPLHAASHWEQEKSIKILIDHKANLLAKNRWGQTPVDVMAHDSHLYNSMSTKTVAVRNELKSRDGGKSPLPDYILNHQKNTIKSCLKGGGMITLKSEIEEPKNEDEGITTPTQEVAAEVPVQEEKTEKIDETRDRVVSVEEPSNSKPSIKSPKDLEQPKESATSSLNKKNKSSKLANVFTMMIEKATPDKKQERRVSFHTFFGSAREQKLRIFKNSIGKYKNRP